LPAGQELVLFNRSWYNRASVERVMGFCSDSEYESFLEEVLPLEHMLIGAGIQIMKYYLDISKKEQKKRLRDRRNSFDTVEDEPHRRGRSEEVGRVYRSSGYDVCANVEPAFSLDRRPCR
jgi:hypothetical protein